MRFYTKQHHAYCGIDLHARSMDVCIRNQDGETMRHRNMTASPEPLLKAIAPYGDDLVIAVECVFTWYWLADLGAREGIPFVLGHALYMTAIHGGQAKNDQIDAQKIAVLLRGGLLPQAYIYPAEMRALQPQSLTMRALAQLVEHRRRVVGAKVRITNCHTSTLKNSFPHVLHWFQDKDPHIFCDFLSRWPTLKVAQLARRSTLETVLHDHHGREERGSPRAFTP